MPRPKKTDGSSSVHLISDTISPDTPIPDLSALGDLAAPITFPEDQAKPESEVPKRHRGRPRKVHSEESETVAMQNVQEQTFRPEPRNEIHPDEFSKDIPAPTSELSDEPVITATPGTSELSEENQGTLPAEAGTTVAAASTENPSADMSAVQNNPAFEAPMPDAPFSGSNRYSRRFGNNNENFGNNNFNPNFNNNRHGKFNKFGRNKYGKNNRYLPDDIPDDQLQAPPADPEKVAVAMQRWRELRNTPMFDLQEKAVSLNIPDVKRLKKQALIYRILGAISGEGAPIYTEGTLEIMKEGYGFLRNADLNYLAGQDDIYISPNQIRRFELKSGDSITGLVRQPRDNERYFGLARVDTVNGEDPAKTKHRVAFEYLTPIHPYQKLNLEWKQDEYSTRIMDLFSPIGKGQRSILLAPPRTGKTVLLQNIAGAIAKNHPEVKLFVLLIDERPEEVTDMRRHVKGEVIASTFDEPPEHHTQVADILLEKAKRLVEYGNDVVILLDSITRFARANNVVIPHSGKILSGGVDALAMQRPKRFFGAARKIENGGSLTIIGTALIDTGSRMDEVIFEEFKGTGNMELVLDRRIAEKRIWPAIDIFKSGTRKEELLLDDDTLRRVWILRKFLQEQTSVEIMEFMRDKLSKTKTNEEFLASMNG